MLDIQNNIFKNKIVFDCGINFIVTTDKDFQKNFYKALKESAGVYVYNGCSVTVKELCRLIYYINVNESNVFNRHRRFKHYVKQNSEICKFFEVPDKVFEQKLFTLWHSSYICSSIIGIDKGKKILIMPYITSMELSVQSYRFKKLSDYAVQNGIVVVIPVEKVNVNSCNYYYKVCDNI